jgi:hypothetical protein
MTVDLYISPRELEEGGFEMRSTISNFIQAFGRDIAFPHLQRFATRCHAEGVRPPKPPSKPAFPNFGVLTRTSTNPSPWYACMREAPLNIS